MKNFSTNPTAVGATQPCRVCDEGTATLSLQTQTFQYGQGKEGALITAEVPVWTCDHCEAEYIDEMGEVVQHAAVCAHLGRLTPAEIRAIRSMHGATQEEFARVTRVGVASLKRWESGALIQNDAMDALMRLAQHRPTYERLRKKAAPHEAQFRTPISDESKSRAKQFRLRECSAYEYARAA